MLLEKCRWLQTAVIEKLLAGSFSISLWTNSPDSSVGFSKCYFMLQESDIPGRESLTKMLLSCIVGDVGSCVFGV